MKKKRKSRPKTTRQDEVGVPFVEEPQQAASDDEAGGHVEPEAVVARLPQIDAHRSGEEDEADQDAEDGRPVAAVRDQVGP